MKKIFMTGILALCTASVFAVNAVDGINMKMENTEYSKSSNYNNTYTVLNNTVNVYEYKDSVIALPNDIRGVIYRVRIHRKWYVVSEKDFGIARSGKMTRKQIKKIQKEACQ